jgi:hypothetical protein
MVINNTTSLNFNPLIEVIFFYFETVIVFIGVIVNLFCIIIFSMINKSITCNCQMYKYFLMKSIIDFVIFTGLTINPLYNLSSFNLKHNFILQVYSKYYFHHLYLLLLLYSVYFEVLGTFDCLISIQNRYKLFLSKKAFYLNSIFVFVFFFLFYLSKIFVYEIVPISPRLYELKKTRFYFSLFYRTLSILYFVLRDILGNLLLFIFNIMIFIKLKRLSDRKKNLKNGSAVAKSIKAQEDKVKMIYYSCFNSIICHLPEAYFNIYGKYHTSNNIDYSHLYLNIILVSFVAPFFIYISFNKIFQKYSLKLIKKVLFCLNLQNTY